MGLRIRKIFITINLFLVMLSSGATELNLSQASLISGIGGGLTHGHLLFEVDEGKVKIGPTFGFSYGANVTTGFRIEFYSDRTDKPKKTYFSIGSFILHDTSEGDRIVIAYTAIGRHKKLDWNYKGGNFHSKFGGGIALYVKGSDYNENNDIGPTARTLDSLPYPFLEWKLGITI